MLDHPATREIIAPPNQRQIDTACDTGLPAGTEVFSADDHISLAADIWHERFPAHLKAKAPRVWQADDAFHVGIDGKSFLPQSFSEVVRPFDTMPGGNTAGLVARLKDLDADGVTKELVFPNAVFALLQYPDFEVRELCFRIYNQYIAELQAQAPGRFYAVGVINWWDRAGARECLAELKALGIKTFLLPLLPGKGRNGELIDYCSMAMDPIWEEIEASGLPVAHHIGEGGGPQAEFNRLAISILQNLTPFREMFGKYIFGGILDRHPNLQVGWFEGGIHWVPTTLQDADHIRSHYAHFSNLKIKHEPAYYWDQHMCASFMVDPLGLSMIEQIGVERALWSSDYPHNESTFGYSRRAVRMIVDTVGPESAGKICSENIKRFLKI